MHTNLQGCKFGTNMHWIIIEVVCPGHPRSQLRHTLTSKRGSIPKKVARAILCTGIPKSNAFWFIYEKNQSSYISTGTTQMETLVGYKTLATGKFIWKRKNSKKRKNDKAVDDLVKFFVKFR